MRASQAASCEAQRAAWEASEEIFRKIKKIENKACKDVKGVYNSRPGTEEVLKNQRPSAAMLFNKTIKQSVWALV